MMGNCEATQIRRSHNYNYTIVSIVIYGEHQRSEVRTFNVQYMTETSIIECSQVGQMLLFFAAIQQHQHDVRPKKKRSMRSRDTSMMPVLALAYRKLGELGNVQVQLHPLGLASTSCLSIPVYLALYIVHYYNTL